MMELGHGLLLNLKNLAVGGLGEKIEFAARTRRLNISCPQVSVCGHTKSPMHDSMLESLSARKRFLEFKMRQQTSDTENKESE